MRTRCSYTQMLAVIAQKKTNMNQQQELEQNISELIDKYLLRTTKLKTKKSSTVDIRIALEERTGEYISKSRLNEILVSKDRFEVTKENALIYDFNIHETDVSLLRSSKEILDKLRTGSNYPFKEYTKLRKYRRAIDYKYTFKYRIKLECSDFFGKQIFSEKFVCEVIARELGIDSSSLIDYINFLNLDSWPTIPQELLERLLEIFNITYEESITNQNYYR